jgi:hypothetical protein
MFYDVYNVLLSVLRIQAAILQAHVHTYLYSSVHFSEHVHVSSERELIRLAWLTRF